MLRSHRDLRVAQLAVAVVAAWRVYAAAALKRTESVIAALPKKGRGRPSKQQI
jgi:hypothetical protein